MGVALPVIEGTNTGVPTARLRFEASKQAIPELLGLGCDETEHVIILVCCGRRKLRRTARADELYSSPRSRLSVQLAYALRAQFSLVSAAHGLIDPDRLLEPYDVEISGLSTTERESWQRELISSLSAAYGRTGKRFIILGSGAYASEIATALNHLGLPYCAPLFGLPASLQLTWLKKALAVARRFRDLSSVYRELDRLKESGSIMPLTALLERTSLPQRGVYIFLDPDEPSLFSNEHRIVRVGTHAVSAGSKATLRTRLRTHRGTTAGSGNHRSSIFRLHVGSAILGKDADREIPSWGAGDSAAADVSSAEAELEAAVSAYIGRLHVALLRAEDAPSKSSIRRVIERNLIALLTEDAIILDKPSSNWLGNWSARSVIRESGLWNVNDVFSSYNPRLMSLVCWSE